MQELISRIIENVGIDEGVAKSAVGTILGMLKSVLSDEQVASIMAVLPGAEYLVAQAGEQSGGGGLGGMLSGALGALGGNSALADTLGKLQGLGLSTEQSMGVGEQVLGFLKEKAPPEVASAIEEKMSLS